MTTASTPNPNPSLDLQPCVFLINAQGPYILAEPGDVQPYVLTWEDTIQYPAETISSVSWIFPPGLAGGPNSALYCAPLSPAYTALSAWTGITTGSLALSINGSSVTNVTGVSFSGLTSFAAIAAALQTALQTAFSDLCTVTYDAVNGRFIFASPTVGPTGSVSFLTPVGSGIDLTGMLSGLSTSLGGVSSNIPAYQAPGVTAASVVGAASTAWIASPIVGIFEVVATLVSSLNRVKSKAFQLIVAQNS